MLDESHQERAMHVHGTQMNMYPVNAFAAAAEVALAAQRAATVRKKLLRNAASVQSSTDPDQAFMIDQWTGGTPDLPVGAAPSHSGASTLTEDEYHAAGKVPEFG
jgi:hypothetical protein